jgi:restriction endonuclease S subunit
MAQISIIQHSDVKKAKRIDSEYYKPFNLKSEKLITSKSFSRLKDVGNFIIGPFGSTVKVEDYVETKKYKYIRGKDIKNGILNNEDNVAVSKEKYDSLPRYHLQNNDLLITVVGTIGNVAIYRDSFGPAIFSCKSSILRPNKITSELLMIFLLSKYGKSLLMRNERGAIQKGFNLPDLKNIPIPNFTKEFKETINTIVLKSSGKQQQSKQLYKEAETILLEELDLLNYKTEQPLTFSTTRKEVETAKRFDAEYFQPKYEKIIKHIENYSGGYDVVKNFVTWKKGIEVGSDAYTETGKEFVRVSDCSTFDIKESSRKISASMFEGLQKKYQPKRGDIIFTKDGTIGITSVLKDDIDGVLSSAFLSLTLKAKYKSYNKECFALILNSIVTKMQVEQLSGGAIIAHLKPSDFEKFKLPIIRPSIQQQIAEKVNRSHQLRKESKELLEEAKRRVEEEIEKRRIL